MAKKDREQDESPVVSQFNGLQSIVDINKILDDKAKDQGIIFSAVKKENRITGAVSTGILSFDLVMGGGYAPGTFSYIYGPTGCCKSTLLAHTTKAAIEAGLIASFHDHELSVDPAYFEKIGIKLDRVCGMMNKRGEWEETPKLRYSMGTTTEATFKFMNQVMKALPDKITMTDDGETRHFLVAPDFEYTRTWMSVKRGLKEDKIVEVDGNAPQMVFLADSLRAMLPEARDEEIDKDPMALSARTFGLCFPLVKTLLGRKNCLFVVTNQLTINPMARFQCLHGDTVVPLVDGSSKTMREIVDGKLCGEVWSYNEQSKKMAPAKIVGWHNNGNVEEPDDFVTVTCEALDTRNGVASFTCTKNHEVMTADGWKQAGSLTSDDLLLSKYQSSINGTLKSFLLGAFVGDSTIFAKNDKWTPHLRFQDNTNPDYVAWKVDKLREQIQFKRVNAKLPYYVSESRHEFRVWKNLIGRRDPTSIIDLMDDVSLAIWFMDDGNGCVDEGHYSGSLSVKRLRGDIGRLLELKEGFVRHGLECSVNATDGVLCFNKQAYLLLCERICKYVPECMQYKLPPAFRGRYKEFDLTSSPTTETEFVQIWSIADGSERKFRLKGKYDISVEGTHNYLVGNVDNGVIVHNSPEVEPGGSAVQFYPDFKLKLNVNRAQSKIIEEAHFTGDGVDRYLMGYATVLKNKFGPSFRKVEFRLWLDERGDPGRGIDSVFDMYNFLSITNQLEETKDKKTKETSVRVLMDGFGDTTYTWTDFKNFVVNLDGGKDLRKKCYEMLHAGKAQELYYDYVKSGKGDEKEKEKDEKEKKGKVSEL